MKAKKQSFFSKVLEIFVSVCLVFAGLLVLESDQNRYLVKVEGIVQPEFRSIVYEVNNANWVTVTLYFSHSDDYINAQAFVSGTQDKGYITDFSPVYCENSTCWSIFEIGLGESDSYHVDIELVDSDGNQDWFSTNLYYGPWGVSLP